ncbi:hypothetical protein ABW19_dt0201629 [Dactylella cylindrospora]|nr:hypothetical protein ABW19_dt0201629 [Dactylella cylindrospora]
MSTPQPSTSTPVVEKVEKDKSKRRSIQRFVSKIIKTGKKKAEPTESSAAPAPAPEVPEASTSAAATAEPAPPVAAEIKETPAEASASKIPIGAKQLAEKHGIEITEDWPYTRPPVGERVEKPIRMRVRRYCHLCETAFGSEKACPSCGHKRCVDCPRSPAAKTDKKKSKTKHKEFDPYEGLTLPRKPGGQDLVHRKIRQRVHYKCHKCETDFAGQKVCGQCSHTRCKKCHREPSRKPKPVEEVKKKKPFKWTCSECDTSGNTGRSCSSCNHSRCVDCVKEIPKRKKPIIPTGAASDTDTKEEGLIDKVTSALASTSIAS